MAKREKNIEVAPQVAAVEGHSRLTYHNLATNEEVRDWVTGHVIPMLGEVRDDRVVLEDRWLHFWRIYNVELDDQSYQGRSRVYLSAGRNAIETWKIGLLEGLFPTTDWFDCEARHYVGGLEGNAMALKALLKQQMEAMDIRGAFEEGLQQFLTFGNMVLRLCWVDEEEVHRFYERGGPDIPEGTTVIREEPEEDTLSFTSARGERVRLVERKVKKFYGPQIRVVDLFHFYVSPITARSVEEAELAFEDMTVSLDYIEAQSLKLMDERHPEQGYLFENVEDCLATEGGRLPNDILDTEYERHDREGLEQDANLPFSNLEDGFVNLSDCRWRGEIPGARDPYTKKEYGVIDWKIQIVNDTWPVAIYPNPAYRKRRPWLMGRLIHLTNEAYGRGMVEPFASLQYMLNDVGNLTIDNLVLSLNPIALIDDEKVHNFDSLEFAPAAKWFVEKDAVSFMNTPNVAQIGMTTINMMLGFIQDFSGANFATQGTPAPRGRGRAQNTATGMAMLQQSGSAGFNAAMKTLQKQVMVPLLQAMYEMLEQFMTDKQIVIMGGKDGIPLIEREVGFEDVVGSYTFKWLGAQQVMEKQGLTQNLIGFIQMLAQIRAADPEAAGAFRIKWAPLIKRALTDGMGLSWADEIIETPDDQKTVDPLLENDLMANHRDMPVSPGDDDDAHLAGHESVLDKEPFRNDPIARQLLVEHAMKHQEAKQKKQMEQMMQQMQQMMQQQQQGQQGGPPGMASPPSPGGQGGPAQQAAASAQPQGVPNMGGM
jgi:hypothetical protein